MNRHVPSPVRTATLARRSHRIRLLIAAAVLGAAAALAPWAQARPTLPELLPPDVAFAVGASDLASQSERFAPFLEEAERLELARHLSALFPADLASEAGLDAESELGGLVGGWGELDPMELVGREAWLVVSASRLRPLPALTGVARATPEAEAAFAAWIADAAERPGTTRRTEGDAVLYTYLPEAGATDRDGSAMPEVPVAYAQADDLLVVSTDPEVVRAVLRAHAGGSDPVWADSEGYRALDRLGDGHLRTFLDPDPLLAGLAPVATSFGAGPVLERLRDAMRTVGPTVGRVRFEADGVASASLRTPDRNGPDPALARLLTEARAADPAVVATAPADALSVASVGHDLSGWWAWLDDLLAAAATLGLPDASEAASLFGLDPKRTVLSWTGDRSVAIVTGPAAPTTPGTVAGSLLGEEALLIATDRPEAARTGVQETFTNVGALLGGFLAPSGVGAVAPETVEVAGVEVLRLRLSEALIVDAAPLDGWLLLTGSPSATEAVLRARAAGDAGPAPLVAAAADLPSDAVAWTVADDGATLRGSVDGLVAQLQLLAGLGGAGALDFDAVDAASTSLRAYVGFVADRLGVRVAHTTLEDDSLMHRSFSEVAW